MVDADFGYGVRVDDILTETLSEDITTNSIETQLMLLESYDIYHGIYNHGDSTSKPLALVELHTVEDFKRVNPLYELFRTYVSSEVLKYTGIPYDRFIELPRDITRQLIEDCKKYAIKDKQSSQEMLDELNAIQESGKKK